MNELNDDSEGNSFQKISNQKDQQELQEEIEGLNDLVEQLTKQNNELQAKQTVSEINHKKEIDQLKQSNLQSFQLQLDYEKSKQNINILNQQIDQYKKQELVFNEQIESLNQTIQQHKDLLSKYTSQATSFDKQILQQKIQLENFQQLNQNLEQKLQDINGQFQISQSKTLNLESNLENKNRQFVTLKQQYEFLEQKYQKSLNNKLPKEFVMQIIGQIKTQSEMFLKSNEKQKLDEIINTIQNVIQKFE